MADPAWIKAVNNKYLPPDIKSLELLHALWFLEVAARLNSYTRASRKLSVTQSAVSKQVRKLEENLQLQLFDRRNAQVSLSGAGASLLEGRSAASRSPRPGRLAGRCNSGLYDLRQERIDERLLNCIERL